MVWDVIRWARFCSGHRTRERRRTEAVAHHQTDTFVPHQCACGEARDKVSGNKRLLLQDVAKQARGSGHRADAVQCAKYQSRLDHLLQALGKKALQHRIRRKREDHAHRTCYHEGGRHAIC